MKGFSDELMELANPGSVLKCGGERARKNDAVISAWAFRKVALRSPTYVHGGSRGLARESSKIFASPEGRLDIVVDD
jgi:hypothetical protein